MPDETRDHPDASFPRAPAPAESAPPGEDGPVAVPDPERARILADYDTARERDRAARAAAAEPDAKRTALDALTGSLTRRAETDPERIEADPEHPPASDPAPKLPEHLAAAAARVTEVGPRKVADPEAARRLAALDEPARSEPPARAAETAPAPAQNGKRPRGKERRKATEPAKRRRKRAADDARAQRRAELTADLERAADTPALLVRDGPPDVGRQP